MENFTIQETPRNFIFPSQEELNAAMRYIAADVMAEKAKEQKDYLIMLADAMRLLKKSRATLWHWNKVGYLVTVKVGKSVYYRMSDIIRICGGVTPATHDAMQKGGIA